jgi:hypothetical protein
MLRNYFLIIYHFNTGCVVNAFTLKQSVRILIHLVFSTVSNKGIVAEYLLSAPFSFIKCDNESLFFSPFISF